MIKIFIPYNFKSERKYIIDFIFEDFLGLKYELFFDDYNKYKIHLENKKILEFNDDFWLKFKESESYLDFKNIPEKVNFYKNQFTTEEDIPVIFGNGDLKITENHIYCGIDIFASSFFMLSRWEEAVLEEKDEHKRFPCNLSLAQKNNFHHRPVVNEYIEMLWNMMIFLGCKQPRKPRNFELIPTHDIDFLYQFYPHFYGIKNILGDLFKRKDLKLASDTTTKYFAYILKKQTDPFDSFNFFMDISEKHNLKSRFYFIAGKIGETDVYYNFEDKKVEKLLLKIVERGHIVGIHGGYDSFDNSIQLQKEIDRFLKYGIEVNESRQHFLRFKNPQTWQILNNSGIKYDYTIGFSNNSGFRAGICNEYPVFDIKKRIKLNLKERPLIFMETSSQKKFPVKKDFVNHCHELKNKVKKYKGQFVFLWHNSNVKSYLWQNYIDLYPEIFH